MFIWQGCVDDLAVMVKSTCWSDWVLNGFHVHFSTALPYTYCTPHTAGYELAGEDQTVRRSEDLTSEVRSSDGGDRYLLFLCLDLSKRKKALQDYTIVHHERFEFWEQFGGRDEWQESALSLGQSKHLWSHSRSLHLTLLGSTQRTSHMLYKFMDNWIFHSGRTIQKPFVNLVPMWYKHFHPRTNFSTWAFARFCSYSSLSSVACLRFYWNRGWLACKRVRNKRKLERSGSTTSNEAWRRSKFWGKSGSSAAALPFSFWESGWNVKHIGRELQNGDRIRRRRSKT